MRLAVLTSRVATPAECARTPLDSQSILALSGEHDFVLCVDEDSPGVEELRTAGVRVHVGDKRLLHLPGGREIDSDEAESDWLNAQHTEAPFDALLAGSDRPWDRLMTRPDLRDVPLGVVAGDGPAAHAVRLGADRVWLDRHAHELWLAASRLQSADFVVGHAPPEAYGMAATGVPWGPLTSMSDLVAAEEVSGGLVVVVATGIGSHQAGRLVPDAIARIRFAPSTTIVVIVPEDISDASPVAPAVATSVPPRLRTSVVIVPAGRNGDAGCFLEVADAIIAHDASDLAIPAVRRRALGVPTAVLHPAASVAPLAKLDRRSSTARAVLVPMSPAVELVAVLDGLMEDPRADVAVFHDPATAGEAARLLGRREVLESDATVFAPPRPPYGMADAQHPVAGLVAVHRRMWGSLRQLLMRGTSPDEMAATLVGVSGIGAYSLAVLLTQGTAPTSGNRVVPEWFVDHGPLTCLRVAPSDGAVTSEPLAQPQVAVVEQRPPEQPESESLRDWVKAHHWRARARLALPWRLGLANVVRDGELPEEVVAWIKSHRAADRARLALPWKLGLLPRAMEGRW